MKKAMIAAMFFVASIAQSEIIATMPNKAGGMIYLTNNVTEKCKPMRAMFANSASGNSIFGCWFLDEIVIHIKWDDSGTSAFPVEGFTLVKKSKGTDL